LRGEAASKLTAQEKQLIEEWFPHLPLRIQPQFDVEALRKDVPAGGK
jgi:hypothetical protein